MRPVISTPAEPAQDKSPAAPQPLCPICSGLLIDLRGFVRCSRCHFSMCAGCEGEAWYAAADPH
jgi:hypothetical protein